MTEPKDILMDRIDRTANPLCFAESIGLERVAKGRYSAVFLTELIDIVSNSKNINPSIIMEEIKYLEGCHPSTGTKEASLFTGKFLSGLWHKHYREISLHSIARNLQLALNEYSIQSIAASAKEAEESGEERYITIDDIAEIVADVGCGNYKRRSDAGKLTGEWIIFAKNEGQNYYLCLGNHDSGDEVIRKKIESVCIVEYPFLTDILK